MLKKVRDRRMNWLGILLIMLVAVIVLTPEIAHHALAFGDDYWFHMSRAYESMKQIQTGHLSYFLNLFSFESAGRIINAVYGPLGGYLEGLLLWLSRSWYVWLLLNSFLVLVVSGLSMNYVLQKISDHRISNTLISMVYMLSFPFLHWVLLQYFSGFSSMLIPWVIYSEFIMIKRRNINSLKLALLMALITQIHLMTAVISTASLILCFLLVNLTEHDLVKLWRKILWAVGWYLILTINVWGSLLEVMLSNRGKLIQTAPYKGMTAYYSALHFRTLIRSRWGIGLGLVLLFCLGFLWGVKHLKTLQQRPVLINLIVQSAGFLWLASAYFPWNHLAARLPIIRSDIQSPDRFLPIAIVSVLFLTAQIIDCLHYSAHRKLSVPVGVAILLLIVGSYVWSDVSFTNYNLSQYYTQSKVVHWLNMRKIGRYPTPQLRRTLHSDHPGTFLHLIQNTVPDYLPARRRNSNQQYYRLQPSLLNQNDIIKNPLRVHRRIVGRNRERLTFSRTPGQVVKVPFVKYAHTRIRLNGRVLQHARTTGIGSLVIRSRQRHNVLTAQYYPSRWYQVLIVIEIIGVLIFVYLLMFKKRSTRNG